MIESTALERRPITMPLRTRPMMNPTLFYQWYFLCQIGGDGEVMKNKVSKIMHIEPKTKYANAQ